MNSEMIDQILGMINAELVEVNTAIECRILSYADGMASVQIVGKKVYPDGEVVDFPIITGVRVCWPTFAGGTGGVKGPILSGDPGLLIVSQQPRDNYTETRKFDLSSSYVIPCACGQVSGMGGDNSALNVWLGSAYFQIKSNGDIRIEGETVRIRANKAIEYDTPLNKTRNYMQTQELTGP